MSKPVMLVTGGSRGIGAGIAVAASAVGYDVVITYERSKDAADTLVADGHAAVALQSDAGDPDTTQVTFNAVLERFGRVDALINNAGGGGAYGPIGIVDADMLTRLWAVNITAPFLYAKAAVAHMSTDLGGRGGNIVNITSKAAVLGGSGEWIHYAASKGALETMTTGLAKEVATQGIRVNAVRPGLIVTDFDKVLSPGRTERMRTMIPMQRTGSAAEVAAAVIWLCSDAASYTTGTFLEVTGGR